MTEMQKVSESHHQRAKLWGLMTGFWFSHYITQRCLCFPPGKHQINIKATNLLALTKRIQKSILIRTNIIFLITKFMWVLELNVRSKFPWWGPHVFGQVKIWEPIVFLNIGLKLRFQVLKTWVLISWCPNTATKTGIDYWALCITKGKHLCW